MSSDYDDILNILGDDLFEDHNSITSSYKEVSPLPRAEQKNALGKNFSIEHNRTQYSASNVGDNYNFEGFQTNDNSDDTATSTSSKRIDKFPLDTDEDYNLQDFNSTSGGFNLVDNKAVTPSNKELDYDALLGDSFRKRIDKPTVKADDYNFEGFNDSLDDKNNTLSNNLENDIKQSNKSDENALVGFDINDVLDAQDEVPISEDGGSLLVKERSEYDGFFNDFYEVIK